MLSISESFFIRDSYYGEFGLHQILIIASVLVIH